MSKEFEAKVKSFIEETANLPEEEVAEKTRIFIGNLSKKEGKELAQTITRNAFDSENLKESIPELLSLCGNNSIYDITKMFRKLFNNDKKKEDAVTFVFWLAYSTEKVCETLLVRKVNGEGNKDLYASTIKYLTFDPKIQLFRKLYQENNEAKKLGDFMNKVKNLRNDVSHGRLDKLKYNGKDLSHKEPQVLLFFEFNRHLTNFNKHLKDS